MQVSALSVPACLFICLSFCLSSCLFVCLFLFVCMFVCFLPFGVCPLVCCFLTRWAQPPHRCAPGLWADGLLHRPHPALSGNRVFCQVKRSSTAKVTNIAHATAPAKAQCAGRWVPLGAQSPSSHLAFFCCWRSLAC